jgi:tetraacyldisaccharide 4'-kinase
MSADALRALLGRRLERGMGGSRLSLLAASAWEAWSARGVSRALRLPAGVCVVGVGGAVLGGAGKTPVAIALARAFAERGEAVALVGHAYRAQPGAPRVVRLDDDVASVGDDALLAARLLARTAAVVVAPGRQAAIDHAAALGHRVLIVDGLLQTSPDRLAAAVLVLDALAPWGSGACPPAGDLRAPRLALLAATDFVVALGPSGHEGGSAPKPALPPGAVPVSSHLTGAVSPAGEAIALDTLVGLRLGLLVAVARPERIVSALARAGVRPAVTRCLADHAFPSAAILASAGRARVDAWLTTARCATKLPATIGRRPVLALHHHVDVAELVSRLATRAGG